MRLGGDAGHVPHPAGAVVDVRQHEDGDGGRGQGVEPLHGLLAGLDEDELAVVLACDGLGDIQVGGEVRPLTDDDPPPRGVRGRDAIAAFSTL